MAIAVDIDQEAINPAIVPYNTPAYDTLLNLAVKNGTYYIYKWGILLFFDILCYMNYIISLNILNSLIMLHL